MGSVDELVAIPVETVGIGAGKEKFDMYDAIGWGDGRSIVDDAVCPLGIYPG